MLGSIFLSIIYSMRIIGRTFFIFVNGYCVLYVSISEAKETTLIVLLFLTFFSVFIGYFFSELFSIIGNSFFVNVSFFKISTNILFENEMIY